MPPSKGKKPSKPPSNPSSFDRSPSTRTPSTPPSRRAETNDAEVEEALLRSLLREASAKFPSFISETAFHGRITDVDSSSQYKGGQARVWLSQAAMVSSSLLPGSLVSVSLSASGKNHLDDFPLEALSDECARYFGVDVDDSKISEAGRYFAIAMIFPSSKVLKNGVRLSWSLSCTMGFPAAGKVVLVSPIGNCSTSHLLNGTDKLHISTDTEISHFSLHKCKDLYLKLSPPSTRTVTNSEKSSPVENFTESGHFPFQNGNVSSPSTPLYRSKISSPGSSASPLLSKGFQDSVSCANRATNLETDISVIKMALEDEKIYELLQIYVVRWLCGRHLLGGNFVTLPICGRFCVFRVQGANQSPVVSSCQDLTYERKSNLLPPESQISTSLEHVAAAFLVDFATKVHLFKSMDSVTETPYKECFLSGKPTDKDFRKKEASTIPRLGGLSKEFDLLKEIISFSLSHRDNLPSYKGVLLHGPPGTGKTSLASWSAHDVGAKLFFVNGPEIVSQYYGESEQALHEVFDSARRAAPAVVFIDELDAIAPARKDGGEELSLRMVATLLNLMDEITRTDGVLVIAATNRPDSIDPALRRPGRLDREIEIGVPSPDQRLDILYTVLSEMDHSLNNMEVQSLALATHGFVGADLAALCNEAAMISLRRYIRFKSSDAVIIDQHSRKQCTRINGYAGDMPGSNFGEENDKSSMDQVDSVSSFLSKMAISSNPCSCCEKVLESTDTAQNGVCRTREIEEELILKVTAEDFEKAKMKVRPSAMREVMLEFPKVCWEDVGGQNGIKKQLIEAVQWPQMCPDAFKRIGIRPPRGLLMFGPPGCSKTLMARAVASEAKLNFLAVKGPELFSKWVGESEKAVKSLFAKARANSPSIIFFDELDGLAITRGQEQDGTSVADRVLSQLLIELDGLDQIFGVTVIAATNRPDKIDPALLRPGRFDRHLDVKPPNEADREDIFDIHIRNMPCSSDVTVKDLARLTEGYTGADIKLICREAAIAALEESFEISEISMEHFKAGIQRVQPSNVQFYLEISEKFRRYVDSGAAKDE